LAQSVLIDRVIKIEVAMSSQPMNVSSAAAPEQPVLHRKFVRVTSPENSEFVHFEFAIGWPDLSAELTLKRDQFEEFCKKHQVEFLGPEDDRAPSLNDLRNTETP
jgi:phenol hydroxylase P0 protein